MLRVLPLLVADGPSQMAADEALLAEATATTLRIYRWQPATVSLGYFQDYAAVVERLPHDMPVVRRITGGGAIWHEHEVTYCLVAQAGVDGMPHRVRDAYPLLHGAMLSELRRALAAMKTVTAESAAALTLQTHSIGDRRYRDEPRCFASPAADDLITTHGAKILGSAGRQRGQRILIHGSLKLASNPWDGDTVTGCGLDFAAAADVVQQACALALGQTISPSAWTIPELSARTSIAAARYANDAWVVHRQGPRP